MSELKAMLDRQMAKAPELRNKTATEIMMKRREEESFRFWRARQRMLDRLAGQLMEDFAPSEPTNWPTAGSVELQPPVMTDDPWKLAINAIDVYGADLAESAMHHNPLAAMCNYSDQHSTERLPVSTAKPAIGGILTERAVTHRLGLGVSYE